MYCIRFGPTSRACPVASHGLPVACTYNFYMDVGMNRYFCFQVRYHRSLPSHTSLSSDLSLPSGSHLSGF